MSLLVDAIQIGAVRNGKVSITVPDENKGVYKTLSVSQDSADSFLSQRMNIEKKRIVMLLEQWLPELLLVQ